jgi:hypothetical protein
MGAKRNAYSLLVECKKERELVRRPRHRWVDNIWMDIGDVVCSGMDWIGLAQDRDHWGLL